MAAENLGNQSNNNNEYPWHELIPSNNHDWRMEYYRASNRLHNSPNEGFVPLSRTEQYRMVPQYLDEHGRTVYYTQPYYTVEVSNGVTERVPIAEPARNATNNNIKKYLTNKKKNSKRRRRSGRKLTANKSNIQRATRTTPEINIPMPVPHATGYMTPDSNIPYARHTPNIMNINDNINSNNNNLPTRKRKPKTGGRKNNKKRQTKKINKRKTKNKIKK